MKKIVNTVDHDKIYVWKNGAKNPEIAFVFFFQKKC
jgi:hypothetical protein